MAPSVHIYTFYILRFRNASFELENRRKKEPYFRTRNLQTAEQADYRKRCFLQIVYLESMNWGILYLTSQFIVRYLHDAIVVPLVCIIQCGDELPGCRTSRTLTNISP